MIERALTSRLYKNVLHFVCSEMGIEQRIVQVVNSLYLFVCFGCYSPQWARASSFTRFLDHTQRRTTVSSTPLDEWSARRRNLYLTTHTQHSQQTNVRAPGGIRTHNLSRRTAEDSRLRPRGQLDRQFCLYRWNTTAGSRTEECPFQTEGTWSNLAEFTLPNRTDVT